MNPLKCGPTLYDREGYTMLIKTSRGWEIPERDHTPESAYLNRRQLLAAAGFFGVSGLLRGATSDKSPYPAKHNPEFTLDRPVTEEWAAESYNNFYEFDESDKANVRNLVGNFKISPWKFEVTGLVNKPRWYDMDDL